VCLRRSEKSRKSTRIKCFVVSCASSKRRWNPLDSNSLAQETHGLRAHYEASRLYFWLIRLRVHELRCHYWSDHGPRSKTCIRPVAIAHSMQHGKLLGECEHGYIPAENPAEVLVRYSRIAGLELQRSDSLSDGLGDMRSSYIIGVAVQTVQSCACCGIKGKSVDHTSVLISSVRRFESPGFGR
jgi:hypothetical protein